MFCSPCESEMPAMPSSPHRKARERAMSCVKSILVSLGIIRGLVALTAPSITIVSAQWLAESGNGVDWLTSSLRELYNVSHGY